MALQNLTVGKKITVGFGLVLLLLVIAGTQSYLGVGGIVDNAKEVIKGHKLGASLAQREVDHLVWAENVSKLFTDDSVVKLMVQTDPTKCAFGKWYYGSGRRVAEEQVPQLKAPMGEIERHHNRLHKSAVAIGKTFRTADLELSSFLREKKADHFAWVIRVEDALLDPNSKGLEGVQIDHTKCSLGRWLYGEEINKLKQSGKGFAAKVDLLYEPHKKIHQGARKIAAFLAQGERDQATVFFKENTQVHLAKVIKLIDGILGWQDEQVKGMRQAKSVFIKDTLPALHDVQKYLRLIRSTAKKNMITHRSMLDSASNTRLVVSIISIVALLVGIVLAFFIIRGITAALTGVSGRMGHGASQLATASSQISSASQSLAEGASEQAASLEESSASLEQVASMSRQNADNAQQADVLMKEASSVVLRANSSMKNLKEAMTKIISASDEMAKIIKTIDEIAFQTNLLALNAAVEAARAGEAGAGFAVVADEVRNLAMRAAEAAKNTSQLIESNIENIRDGSELVNTTDEAFDQVESSAAKVGELVGEIAAASSEQAQGIDQINQAATEMDRVTQQVAANAEQAAASSVEMNAQAATLNDMVKEMARLVGGSGGEASFKIAKPRMGRPALPPPSKEAPVKKAAFASQATAAQKAIPLASEDDFEDF